MRVTVEELIAQLQVVKNKQSFVQFQTSFTEKGTPKIRPGVQRIDELSWNTIIVLDDSGAVV